MHYRVCGQGGTPLVLLHASPTSAKSLEPLMLAMAGQRVVYALDTLGNGDSSPAAVAEPDAAYLGQAALAATASLGLERFDLFGTHTGASLALEAAIAAPERVRKMILNGVVLYSPELRAERLNTPYAPAIQPDAFGTHLIWAWNFQRDQFLFSPWYKRDREHRREANVPTAEELHDRVVEIAKSIRTYHLSYNAAFRHDTAARLPMVKTPTLLACAESDSVYAAQAKVAELLPGSRLATIPALDSREGVALAAKVFEEFLSV